jgi:tight adherence protein B
MKRIAIAALLAAALAAPAAARADAPLQIRHVDLTKLPRVRVTAVAPAGQTPTLLEDGRRAGYSSARELASAEALVLAIDNSESMRGEPLRQAKQAAAGFLAQQRASRSTGLVVFGHEALPLTRPGEATSDVARAISGIAPDTEPGTSLYDAVVASVSRLQRMAAGTRILVVLTDGRDLGSRKSLADAIAAAERSDVVVYAIAAGNRVDRAPLAGLTRATGGAVFDAADVSRLSATYEAVQRDLDRTWQITYLTRGRPGDRIELALRAGPDGSRTVVQIPSQHDRGSLIPASLVRTPAVGAAIVLLAALLLGIAGTAFVRSRRESEVQRLLALHAATGDGSREEEQRSTRLDAIAEWVETSIAELPGSDRLARLVERSGVQMRLGHVPFLACVGAFFLGAAGTIMGAGPGLAILLMLLGLAVPVIALRVASRRRTKAFDRQLPDVLASIASTLRAGHGLRTALRSIAEDGSPPASAEFKRVLGEERLGRPLDEAIAAMCGRVGSPDLDYVATAINVHSQTGGSLATLFDTLSETVRERQRHARRVRALTSMGRMSATVLICLPFGLAALMTLISPSYMAPLFQTAGGHVLIAVCVSSMTLGALVLKRIVNVRY